MKAITVEPKKPGTVRYEDIPEPDVREGSILVEAIAALCLWNGCRDRRRQIWLGATGKDAPGAGT